MLTALHYPWWNIWPLVVCSPLDQVCSTVVTIRCIFIMDLSPATFVIIQLFLNSPIFTRNLNLSNKDNIAPCTSNWWILSASTSSWILEDLCTSTSPIYCKQIVSCAVGSSTTASSDLASYSAYNRRSMRQTIDRLH